MNKFLLFFLMAAVNSGTSIESEAKHELLRQAVVNFNLSTLGFVGSLMIGTIGGAMLLTGHTTEGAVTTATGFAVSAGCIQKQQDAEDKLKELIAGELPG